MTPTELTYLTGGQTAALVAIVSVLCESIPAGSPLANQIAHRLESGIASNLQLAENEHFVQGYQLVQELALEYLRSQPS